MAGLAAGERAGRRPPRAENATVRAAGLRLSPDEATALDAASDPHPVDYPYGELGVDQRARPLPASR